MSEQEKILSEMHELATTNQQLQGELETVRCKLKNELDTLTYKIDKVAYETEEIRREVRDINRTIDKLRYDLLDAVRNNKSSEIREIISGLFPFLCITLPALFVVFMIFLYKMTR